MQLPYLDSVEFRPDPRLHGAGVVARGRRSHDDPPDRRPDDREVPGEADDGEFQIVLDRGEREEGFIMLNTSKPPLDDIRVRQALAYATNRETINQVMNEGDLEIGDGIFAEDSRGGSTCRAASRRPSPPTGATPTTTRRRPPSSSTSTRPRTARSRSSWPTAAPTTAPIDLFKELWTAVGIDVTSP